MRGSKDPTALEERVSKPEWGTKRSCTTCGARFYDMQKTPIICPKCGAENEKDAAKPKRAAATKVAKEPARKPVAKVIPEDIDEDLLDTDDDTDDADLMEDASDLGEDDEDMAEVIEHIEPGEKED